MYVTKCIVKDPLSFNGDNRKQLGTVIGIKSTNIAHVSSRD